MRFDIITLFPEIIETYCSSSILGRAKNQNIISVNTINPRNFTKDKHKRVDDSPYGGGAGMVLMCDPIFSAIESIPKFDNFVTVLLTPQGKPYNHQITLEFSSKDQIIMICGHYEGFDERIRQGINTVEISIGDFILTGGELGALCIVDSVTRLVPGSLGKVESALEDTFSSGLLEYPHYTRPPDYRGMNVPDVLLSGNHKEIAKWRKFQSIKRTYERRPDLFSKFLKKKHTKENKTLLTEFLESLDQKL